MERTRLGIQVYNIAKQYNITQTSVHDVIDCYLRYCKDLLMHGNRVDFFGLVSIVPNEIYSDELTTLAYECNKVADVLSLPRYTVYCLINAYVQDAISAVLSGTVAEIRGIVTVKPIMNMEGDIVTIHSSISQSLRRSLSDNSMVSGFRVHTYKGLREKVK